MFSLAFDCHCTRHPRHRCDSTWEPGQSRRRCFVQGESIGGFAPLEAGSGISTTTFTDGTDSFLAGRSNATGIDTVPMWKHSGDADNKNNGSQRQEKACQQSPNKKLLLAGSNHEILQKGQVSSHV